jgi:hypothetical protein
MFARFASKSADADFTRGEALFLRASVREASNESRSVLMPPSRAMAGRFPSKPI